MRAGMDASRLTCFVGPEYDPIISFGLPFEHEDFQYGKCQLSTRGRSVWVHSSQVRLLHSSVPNNSLLERVGPLGTDVYRDQ